MKTLDIIAKLESLTRYTPVVDGCDCCGRWIEYEDSDEGIMVKVKDLEDIIDELRLDE
jgi:hypothetical protein